MVQIVGRVQHTLVNVVIILGWAEPTLELVGNEPCGTTGWEEPSLRLKGTHFDAGRDPYLWYWWVGRTHLELDSNLFSTTYMSLWGDVGRQLVNFRSIRLNGGQIRPNVVQLAASPGQF